MEENQKQIFINAVTSNDKKTIMETQLRILIPLSRLNIWINEEANEIVHKINKLRSILTGGV